MTSADPTRAELFGGRFRSTALLGVGGSASVYRAEERDPATGELLRVVAVKVLHPHLCHTDAARAAFLAEAERLGRVDHPNVAAVYDFGLHDAGGLTMPWIAMELVTGDTLAHRVAERGPLSPQEAIAALTGILDGLGAAHAAGLVHRDISPANVVTEQLGEHDPVTAASVRLIDFGLAERPGATIRGADVLLSTPAAAPTVVGNLAYLSPEQARGAAVGPASDLYQAAAVLYFLLTAEPPFPRTAPEQVLRAHLSAPPPAPSAVQPAARLVDAVVATGLAKRPEDRFASAAAFRSALGACLSTQRRATATSYPTTRLLTATEDRLTRLPPRTGNSDLSYLNPPTVAAQPALSSSTPGSSAVGLALAAVAAVVVIALLSAFTATSATTRPATSPSATAIAAVSPTPSAPPASAPVQKVTVPALAGLLTAAEGTLNAAGLVVGTITKVPSAEPAGTVLGQSPAAGTPAAPGSRVDVRIASGSNLVPAVAGMTIAEARLVLDEAGFTAAAPADYPEDATVGGSRPAADVLFHRGGTVVLTITAPTAGAAEPTATSSGAG